jgi:hypothetical protein
MTRVPARGPPCHVAVRRVAVGWCRSRAIAHSPALGGRSLPDRSILSVLLCGRGTYRVGGSGHLAPAVMPQKDIQIILYRLSGQDRKLDAIHAQAVKTNQRVSKLEKWQSFIEGGLAILTVLVVPVVVYLITFAEVGSH